MIKKVSANRVILIHLAQNEEDNLAALVNAYQQPRNQGASADVLRDALDAIMHLAESCHLEAWSNDPERPLRVPEKVQAQGLRDRLSAEASCFSWDVDSRLWTSAAGPRGRVPYLWFSITRDGIAAASQMK